MGVERFKLGQCFWLLGPGSVVVTVVIWTSSINQSGLFELNTAWLSEKIPLNKILGWVLTSVAQLVGHHPAKHKVSSSIPGQVTCLGHRLGPGWECVQEATNPMFLSHQCFSPSLSSSFHHSLISKIYILGWKIFTTSVLLFGTN